MKCVIIVNFRAITQVPEQGIVSAVLEKDLAADVLSASIRI
jgi:hypothetical protein